jgi:two-component system LytT family response regulator
MNEKKIIVKTEDIVFLKADNVYTEFYLISGEKQVVSKPLKEYELLLSKTNFYKPHRSFIINNNYVKSYQKANAEIEMQNGLRVNVSRDKKKEFENLILK